MYVINIQWENILSHLHAYFQQLIYLIYIGHYPVAGSFYNYSIRFIDPAWGFAMGWNYAVNWLIVLPFELITAGITIAFWTDPNDTGSPSISVAVWISLFLISVCVVNILGVKGYGEVEFILGIIKLIAIVGFIILGTVINCGGVPSDNRGYIGARYWHDPGAFRNGFKGFCSVFVTASFAFGGTEMGRSSFVPLVFV